MPTSKSSEIDDQIQQLLLFACSTQASYAIPLGLRATVGRNRVFRSEFNLGKYSLLIHSVACIWLSFTSIIMFFPTTNPITAINFNYTVAVTVGLFVLGSIHWFTSARRNFKGPPRPDDDDDDISDDKLLTASCTQVVPEAPAAPAPSEPELQVDKQVEEHANNPLDIA